MNPKFLSVLLLGLLLPAALPASLVNDRKIERLARSSYVYHTVLEDRVKVSAEFGVLTLTGSVEDPAHRALAEDTARHILMVGGIENKITVRSSWPERSDPWITLRIRTRLRLRADVSARTTTVAVRDGTVTLTGTVRDERQKERSALVAGEVPGVQAVLNRLTVAPHEAAPAELIDDPSITGQVLATLRADETTRTLGVRVTTIEGAVRISGDAGSEIQKALVTQLTREVCGVRFVTNLLKAGD